MTRLLILTLPLLTACTSLTESAESHHSAQGVTEVRARVDSGDVSYIGRDWDDGFDVDIDSRAWGSDDEVVARRLEGNRWVTEASGNTLDVIGNTSSTAADVSFRIHGPPNMNLDLRAEGGTVHASGVTGDHRLSASSVYVDDLAGNVIISAGSGGVDARLAPRSGDTITVDARGRVDLTLPWGHDYDLQVWGDAEHGVEVTDLGFSSVVVNPGYFAGTRGPGSTRVDIRAEGGRVTVRMADSAW